jgi:signal transduction histidine kinase
VKDREGIVTGSVAMARDVTERVQQEQAARRGTATVDCPPPPRG